MCYSARVQQSLKSLRAQFGALIDIEQFNLLFKQRIDGSLAKIPRSMEEYFLDSPTLAIEKEIAKNIKSFRQDEISELEKNLFAQKKRLGDGERSLKQKITKKAENEVRVATNKIELFKNKLERLQSPKPVEGDSRIYPGYYASLIVMEKGKKVIQPFRYLLRPQGQAPSFDAKYNGCYNIRRDRLSEVFWWKSIFGKNHGVIAIQSFWENVKLHDFENRKLKKGEKEKNLVLHFTPRDLDTMLVPCLFDTNKEGEFPLHSFAIITDDPSPEVAAAGHDRTPIILKKENVNAWLDTSQKDLRIFQNILTDKQSTYFEHQLAA